MTSQVITAYGLRSGQVLWLTRTGEWSPWITEARVSQNSENLDEMKEIAIISCENNRVTESYTVDVTETSGGPEPTKYRELLRSRGPTVHPQFGPQANLERFSE